jgi:23S rRNA pseudouridine1911/1915/1917 synthase
VSAAEVVPGALDGERVDRAVALVTGLTRAEVSALVDAGAVRVDGRVATSRAGRVRAGQRLDVTVPQRAPDPGVAPDASVAVNVVHEDPDVVVVDKPAGLVVHPGAGQRSGTLAAGLVARYPEIAELGSLPGAGAERPGIVHRLDKGTSGLLVVARSPLAYQRLVADLAGRRVERRYLALVAGSLDADEGVVDAPLGRSNRDPTKVALNAAGRPARTHYRVEGRYGAPVPATLLACRLETGRTHQIRVHMAAIGHPVVGDARYGAACTWRPLGGQRPFLHAGALAFAHPRSGAALAFEAPLPADLAGVLGCMTPAGP